MGHTDMHYQSGTQLWDSYINDKFLVPNLASQSSSLVNRIFQISIWKNHTSFLTIYMHYMTCGNQKKKIQC